MTLLFAALHESASWADPEVPTAGLAGPLIEGG
jgi:hypothetical protein